MQRKGHASSRRDRLAGLLVLGAVLLVFAPIGIGFSGGITGTSSGAPGDFREAGCASSGCHGGGAFVAGALDVIRWAIEDEDGKSLAGNRYEHDAVYTITITLDERNAPESGNHAGFNLYATAGQFTGIDGESQASDDGTEATHVNAGRATWTVQWTAPASGVVVFDLFVNDVDGDGAPNEGDDIYRLGWFLTDDSRALPGAVEEHEAHVGVELPQYWVGLIALAGMVFILVFGFVYLKYVNPHNQDHKDR